MLKPPTKDNLLVAMRVFLGDDLRRIQHAECVLQFACEIQEAEGGDADIIIAAATLHDIGIHEAERKYGSSAGNYQEIEGPPIAAEILKEFNLSCEQIEHICKIIANHHSAKDIDTVEFRAVWDADWLVNIPDEFDMQDKNKIEKLFKRNLKTKTALAIAERLMTEVKLIK